MTRRSGAAAFRWTIRLPIRGPPANAWWRTRNKRRSRSPTGHPARHDFPVMYARSFGPSSWIEPRNGGGDALPAADADGPQNASAARTKGTQRLRMPRVLHHEGATKLAAVTSVLDAI